MLRVLWIACCDFETHHTHRRLAYSPRVQLHTYCKTVYIMTRWWCMTFDCGAVTRVFTVQTNIKSWVMQQDFFRLPTCMWCHIVLTSGVIDRMSWSSNYECMLAKHTQTKTAMETLNSDSHGGLRGLNAAGEENAAELEINRIIENGLAEISTEVL